MSIDPIREGWKTAEDNAEVDQSGPLPLTTPSLRYIPPEHYGQYLRTRDGAFRLEFIHQGDKQNYNAHQAAIAAGNLAVYADGSTRASIKAEAAQKGEMDRIFREELKREEEKIQATREQKLRDQADRERAKLEERLTRQREALSRR